MAEFLDYDISAYPFSGFQIFWNVSSSIKRNLAIFGYIFTGFAMFKFGIWFINLKNVHVTHISFNTIDINLFLHLQKHCMKSVQIQSYFWSEYKKIRTRNNSVFGHFSRSVRDYKSLLKLGRSYFCIAYNFPAHFLHFFLQVF